MRNRLSFVLTFIIVSVAASAQAQTTSFTVVNSGASSYLINGAPNPALTLTRGSTYSFSVNSPGHPFDIKTAAVTGIGSRFDTGVTNQATTNSVLTFTVPASAPNTLFYQCEVHAAMTGQLLIVSAAAPAPSTGVLTASFLAALVLAAGFVMLRRRVARA